MHTIFDLPGVERVVVFSNTPKYLFKHLKELPSIVNLAESMEEKDLLEWLKEESPKAEQSFQSLLSVYVALVCLSFKEYKKVYRHLKLSRECGIRWVPELADICLSSFRIHTSVDFQWSQYSGFRSDAATNWSQIIDRPKPL